MGFSIRLPVLIASAAAALLAGCSQLVPPHLIPIPPEAKALLAQKGMREDAPMFVRIFKEESELEVWKAKDDGRFYHFKTYPICTWSGKLGPKFKQGDKQTPEGFYKVSARMMNPNSSYHLSFNIGYPNAYDRSLNRTGDFIMVHGDCKSAGCYAMTDALIEEIYALAREAFSGGQEAFNLHAYPFRMTQANMKRHRRNRSYGFWRNNLYQGYKDFEVSQLPPKIDVCARRYLSNVSFVNGAPSDPAAACPQYKRLPVEAFPRAPMLQEAKSSAPIQSIPSRQSSAVMSSAVKSSALQSPTPASQAAIGGGGMFGFAPSTPTVAGYLFRNNSVLSK